MMIIIMTIYSSRSYNLFRNVFRLEVDSSHLPPARSDLSDLARKEFSRLIEINSYIKVRSIKLH